MLCDFCHEREAVIFMEQVTGANQKRKINMCFECAVMRGITPDSKNIESSIGRLFKELADVSKKVSEVDSRRCPVCGISFGEIRNTEKAGCPECYEIFKNEFRNILVKKGVKERFRGRMPARLSNIRSLLNDRIILKNKLDDAVKNENFEKAAMYRDYLRALEKTSVADGSVPGDTTEGGKL